MTNSIIELKKAGFAYDGKPVLTDLSFSIQRGEFLGVIGPNGAGKTTLLRLLCRLLSPTNGQVILKQRSITELSTTQIAQTISLVPQEFNMVYPFRVSEVVLMGRHPYLGGALTFERDKDLDIARQAMKRTDCLYLADKYFNELSGGEKQRVIIASALAQSPSILLLDEPTSNLDIKHQVLIYQLLQELQQTDGLTVVSVTHDLNLASIFTNRLLLLRNGRKVNLARPQEVLKRKELEKVYETNLLVGKRAGSKTTYVLPDPKTKQ